MCSTDIVFGVLKKSEAEATSKGISAARSVDDGTYFYGGNHFFNYLSFLLEVCHTSSRIHGNINTLHSFLEAMACKCPHLKGADLFLKILVFVFFFEPRCLGFFDIHFQNVYIGKPFVSVDPEFTHALAVEKACSCRAMRIEDDDTLAAFLFQKFQGIDRYLVIADRYEHKYFDADQLFNISGNDGVHKTSLSLEAIVLVYESQTDNIPLIIV